MDSKFDTFLKNLYRYVRKPARYIGSEYLSIKKDNPKLSWVLAYPDLYEVGMSNTGLKILYNILNSNTDIAAERVFCVATDMKQHMVDNNIPLYSLETYKEISKFDILGVTIQSEIVYTSILQLFDLSNIPFYAKDRDENYPLVIAGGPAIYNPEPIAPFFDIIVIGEGENVILEISDFLIKNSNLTKIEKLKGLSNIEGVYIPLLNSGEKIVNQTIVTNFDKIEGQGYPVVPNIQIVHDRIGVEIQRGCTRGCRFCQAGTTYRPVRQKNPEKIIKTLEKNIEKTGLENVGLLSLSVGDYPAIEPLMVDILNRFKNDKISLSLPSLRTESVTDEMIKKAAEIRKSGFTLAPEAGSDRMRNIINKGNCEHDLLVAAERIFKAGWDHIKLYYIVGLPFENDEDVLSIISLTKKCYSIAKRYFKRPKVEASVNIFIPKPQTPFQWAPFITREQYEQKREILYKNRGRKITLKLTHYNDALLEAFITRGGREFSKVIEKVYRSDIEIEKVNSGRNIELWLEAIENEGINFDFIYKDLNFDTKFSYNHIKPKISENFLWKEYQKAKEMGETTDCVYTKCTGCGVCDFSEIKNEIIDKKDHYPNEIEFEKNENIVNSKNFKYQLHFSKKYPSTTISHLDTQLTITRIFRRGKVPVSYSQGFNQRALIQYYTPLAVGVESDDEVIEFFTYQKIDIDKTLQLLNSVSIDGVKFLSISELKYNKELNFVCDGGKFRYFFNKDMGSCIENLKNNIENISFEKTNKRGKIVKYPLKDYIGDIKVGTKGDIIDIEIKTIDKKTIKPFDILETIFNVDIKNSDFIKVIKLETVLI